MRERETGSKEIDTAVREKRPIKKKDLKSWESLFDLTLEEV